MNRQICVACEGRPAPENNPCAVCGQAADERSELARLAREASPEWDADTARGIWRCGVSSWTQQGGIDPIAAVLASYGGQVDRDAAFIAALKPSVVLRILAEADTLRSEKERAKTRMHQAIDRARDEEVAAQAAELRSSILETKLAWALGRVEAMDCECDPSWSTRKCGRCTILEENP
ncbi:hypothetical protein GURKE_00380 [Brevundimonas phage vB_BpoS-Gurke]|uniref:Uncharacterized protein n=1 Tax=Brevundimonas phage vB_BpoS-Gurke TaxID=2948599 RepID=A0A9E7SSL7_9CAUD|nr:hypothetical protein GURKE_00380 [Brevundimonas phage vB_BpoS-Gurke]